MSPEFASPLNVAPKSAFPPTFPTQPPPPAMLCTTKLGEPFFSVDNTSPTPSNVTFPELLMLVSALVWPSVAFPSTSAPTPPPPPID